MSPSVSASTSAIESATVSTGASASISPVLGPPHRNENVKNNCSHMFVNSPERYYCKCPNECQMSQDNKTCKCPKGFQESVNRTMCLGSVNTKIVLAVTNGYEGRANLCVYRKVQLMLRTAFIIVYVNKKFLFYSSSINRRNHGGS